MTTRVLWLIVTGIAVFTLSQVSAAKLAPALANLALGKPVVASSVESISYPAHYANDGDPNTRWSSQFEDNQWIAIDLEASYEVHQVVLNWEVPIPSRSRLTRVSHCKGRARAAPSSRRTPSPAWPLLV